MPEFQSTRIAVIGLGYVGLPLAVEFSKKYPVIGFDIKEERIAELQEGIDTTREVSRDELQQAENITFTARPEQLAGCTVKIIAVPTPIDVNKRPDLRPLIPASRTAGRFLDRGDMVGKPAHPLYDAVVFAVAHSDFLHLSARDIRKFCREQAVVYDVKNILQDGLADARL